MCTHRLHRFRLFSGNLSRTAEYACDNGHFDADAEPTLLTGSCKCNFPNSGESHSSIGNGNGPEPRQSIDGREAFFVDARILAWADP